jgi:hypothetical protein
LLASVATARGIRVDAAGGFTAPGGNRSLPGTPAGTVSRATIVRAPMADTDLEACGFDSGMRSPALGLPLGVTAAPAWGSGAFASVPVGLLPGRRDSVFVSRYRTSTSTAESGTSNIVRRRGRGDGVGAACTPGGVDSEIGGCCSGRAKGGWKLEPGAGGAGNAALDLESSEVGRSCGNSGVAVALECACGVSSFSAFIRLASPSS